jgi:hypothetical protein
MWPGRILVRFAVGEIEPDSDEDAQDHHEGRKELEEEHAMILAGSW